MPDLRSDLEALRDEWAADYTMDVEQPETASAYKMCARRLGEILASHPAGPDLRERVASMIMGDRDDMDDCRMVADRILALTAHTEAGEWRGPWKCAECGVQTEPTWEHTCNGKISHGTLVPYERRKGGA